MRAHHARVPDLGEARRAALAKGGTDRRLADLRLPVMDERPLEEPDEGFRAFIPEIMERRSRGGRRSPARSSSRRAGTQDRAAAFAPTPSWTGSPPPRQDIGVAQAE